MLHNYQFNLPKSVITKSSLVGLEKGTTVVTWSAGIFLFMPLNAGNQYVFLFITMATVNFDYCVKDIPFKGELLLSFSHFCSSVHCPHFEIIPTFP